MARVHSATVIRNARRGGRGCAAAHGGVNPDGGGPLDTLDQRAPRVHGLAVGGLAVGLDAVEEQRVALARLERDVPLSALREAALVLPLARVRPVVAAGLGEGRLAALVRLGEVDEHGAEAAERIVVRAVLLAVLVPQDLRGSTAGELYDITRTGMHSDGRRPRHAHCYMAAACLQMVASARRCA